MAAFRVSSARQRADLASVLHSLGIPLYRVGQIDDACAAYGEAARTRRCDYELDAALYQEDYAASIQELQLCLQVLVSRSTQGSDEEALR